MAQAQHLVLQVAKCVTGAIGLSNLAVRTSGEELAPAMSRQCNPTSQRSRHMVETLSETARKEPDQPPSSWFVSFASDKGMQILAD
jgi:hypothetical protein